MPTDSRIKTADAPWQRCVSLQVGVSRLLQYQLGVQFVNRHVAYSSRRFIVLVTGLLMLSVAVGVVFSRLYWHYWISPPSVLSWVDNFETIEAIVDVECEPLQTAQSALVSESDLHRLALAYLESPKDYPGGQLWAAIHATSKPVGRANVAPTMVQAICDDLFSSGFVVDGDPGYPLTRRLQGHLAAGRSRKGEQLHIVSLLGGEMSNDHHPVYDVEFMQTGSERRRVTRHHAYFEDIAGIEGMRWFPMAVWTFLAGMLVLGATYMGAYLFLFARRLTSAWSRRRLSR
jgi:hypothetical protein